MVIFAFKKNSDSAVSPCVFSFQDLSLYCLFNTKFKLLELWIGQMQSLLYIFLCCVGLTHIKHIYLIHHLIYERKMQGDSY